jgi:hypothetical protein
VPTKKPEIEFSANAAGVKKLKLFPFNSFGQCEIGYRVFLKKKRPISFLRIARGKVLVYTDSILPSHASVMA